MAGRLEGRHVLITGAAGGIGSACARRLASEGAQLLLADLEGERVKALGQELDQSWIEADVTRASDIQRMIDRA
jgi:NAD(P)-dependent dehydrogenase (short-subunit alcohol dehydrogenase family)